MSRIVAVIVFSVADVSAAPLDIKVLKKFEIEIWIKIDYYKQYPNPY